MKGKGKIMNSILEQIKNAGIIPVIEIEYLKNTVPLAGALWEGGLRCVEITFRTPIAAEAIRLIKKAYPEMLIGAGTILTKKQVDEAIVSGAEFIVSPGFDPEIVDFCVERKRVVLPGCVTASEIVQAVKRGLKFMPTGGINAKNLEEYLSCFYPKIIGVNIHIHIQKNAPRGCDKSRELSDSFCILESFQLFHQNQHVTIKM